MGRSIAISGLRIVLENKPLGGRPCKPSSIDDIRKCVTLCNRVLKLLDKDKKKIVECYSVDSPVYASIYTLAHGQSPLTTKKMEHLIMKRGKKYQEINSNFGETATISHTQVFKCFSHCIYYHVWLLIAALEVETKHCAAAMELDEHVRKNYRKLLKTFRHCVDDVFCNLKLALNEHLPVTLTEIIFNYILDSDSLREQILIENPVPDWH